MVHNFAICLEAEVTFFAQIRPNGGVGKVTTLRNSCGAYSIGMKVGRYSFFYPRISCRRLLEDITRLVHQKTRTPPLPPFTLKFNSYQPML